VTRALKTAEPRSPAAPATAMFLKADILMLLNWLSVVVVVEVDSVDCWLFDE
jgi:hypothetical protein